MGGNCLTERSRTVRHHHKDHLADDPLDDVREPLKKALNLDDSHFERMSPEVKNLLSGRRRIGVSWLDDYEVVVEVVSNDTCHCGVAPGQVVVFDMRHRIKTEKSTAPLCMHMLSPILAIFYMSFDRASEGLNPLTRVWTHHECLDTGGDEGVGKARTLVYLRRTDTHEVVDDPVLAMEAGA